MKILVISNFYPPYFIGGYELGCRDVVEALKTRGHEVKVLTSTYQVGKPECDGEVYRWLATDIEREGQHSTWFWARLLKKEIRNQRAFKRLCRSYKPDLIYIWNLASVSISLAVRAQELGYPVCYFVSDMWLARWDSDPWYSFTNVPSPHPVKRLVQAFLRWLPRSSAFLLVSPSLDLRSAQFASLHLKTATLQAGKPVANTKTIHWGINVDQYPYKEISRSCRRLLYVGQLVPHKGVHTAVEALKLVVQKDELVTLTIVGGTILPEYEAHLRHLVSNLALEQNIRFTGLVPRESLPSIYQEHDILVFPSEWDEPFSITLLEAMSSGLAIVSASTGGTPEILEDETNALIFPKADPRACAAQVLRLIHDSRLFEQLRQNGRRTVETRFQFDVMVDCIEASLQEVVKKARWNEDSGLA